MFPSTHSRYCLFVAAMVASVGIALPHRADGLVHLWEISQVYSNDDGSVQFIEMFNDFNSEQFTQNREIVTSRDNGQDEQRFTFPSNLPSSQTANRHVLIATGPIEGVTPDFVIPENFIPIDFDENAMVFLSFSDMLRNRLVYTSIPTDGFRSLDGDGNVKEPATVTNFAGETATLSPVEPDPPVLPEIVQLERSNNIFQLTFTTEEGREYTVQFVDSLNSNEWQVLDVITGTGETREVADPDAGGPMRFYRIVIE
ncbi:MAG: hypothetical protein WD490_09680 [Opitutales bacterium]